MESVEAVEVFSRNSARFRYRVPMSVLRELQYEGSHYSDEFEVGGWLWRFHLQERTAEGERYLALHLQSCSQGSVPVNFKLSVVCMRDPLQSKSKAFHCTFKKAGSAWGLHQFVLMRRLLSPDGGFVYMVEETGTRCVDFEVTMQVDNGGSGGGGGGGSGRMPSAPQSRAASAQRRIGTSGMRSGMSNNNNNNMSSNSPYGGAMVGGGGSPARGSPARTGRAGALVPMDSSMDRRGLGMGGNSSGFGGPRGLSGQDGYGEPSASLPRHSNQGMALTVTGAAGAAAVAEASRAPLAYPFEHLEALCDMTFDVQGVRVKAHRCVIGARMRPLLPEQMLPLQSGCIVAIAVPLDVFTTFLKFVYTEDCPENGVLPAESLLDLYLLAAACEFYDLCQLCIRFVRPLLTPENVLPIVLTRYNAADEVLTSLYLNVLLEYYDALIEDKQFEEIPGHLFRRISLILSGRETVPTVPIPVCKNTLGKQLVWLAETGEYSDFDWVVSPEQYTVRAHRYILACRSVVFSQAMNPRSRAPLPAFTGPEFDFSLRSWQKLLANMYRRHLDASRDISAEDIAIVFKMHHTLGMDGHLKREADDAFSPANALRLLVYAMKHQIPELHERAIAYVSNNFTEMARNDPQVWDLISDLPQTAVISLFRTVVENQR